MVPYIWQGRYWKQITMVEMDNKQHLMQSKRITDRLKEYWEAKLVGNADIPDSNSINADEIRDIWDWCYLAHPHVNDGEYYYDYVGNQLVQALGETQTANMIEALVYPPTSRVVQKYGQVLHTKLPMFDDGVFFNKDNLEIRYRQLLVPLGNSEGEATHIMGGMRWKIFE